MKFIKVVLPAPEEPTIAVRLPFLISKLIPFKMGLMGVFLVAGTQVIKSSNLNSKPKNYVLVRAISSL